MRYILEVRDGPEVESNILGTTEFTEEEGELANAAFLKATHDWRGKVGQTALWREFDSMEEAPYGAGYRIIEKDGKKTLRSCLAACLGGSDYRWP